MIFRANRKTSDYIAAGLAAGLIDGTEKSIDEWIDKVAEGKRKKRIKRIIERRK